LSKTWALLIEALRHINNPQFGAVIFRRSSPQITNQGGLWDESVTLFPKVGGHAVPSRLTWRFPSGAKIRFSHMQYASDALDWQGSQVPYFGWDEITHFEESQFFYLLSRGRSMSGVRPYVRATCNPSPGWVKTFLSPWLDKGIEPEKRAKSGEIRHFIRVNGQIVWVDESYRDEDGDRAMSVTFIRSSIYDNKKLLATNPEYLTNLKSLNAVDRARLLDGDWDVFEGAFFSEFSENLHTCLPLFQPDTRPSYYTYFGGFDWGYRAKASFGLYCSDEGGNVLCIDEWVATGLENNEMANKIVATLMKWRLDTGDVMIAADPSMWAKKKTSDGIGKADVEDFWSAGLAMVEANNNRRHGWSRVREYLHTPGAFRMFRGNCTDLITSFPLMKFAETGDLEDMDTTGDDHSQDRNRYALMTRPKPSVKPQPDPADEIPQWMRDRYGMGEKKRRF
jgi:hypothetical protein